MRCVHEILASKEIIATLNKQTFHLQKFESYNYSIAACIIVKDDIVGRCIKKIASH